VRSLTSTIPIVAIDLETDPLGSGMVKGLARPGGNITGLFLDFPDFSKKWLELMKEALPQLAKIGVLWDPATGFRQLKAIEEVAGLMNLKLEIIEVRALSELDAAMAAASRNNPDALVMLSMPIIGGSYQLIRHARGLGRRSGVGVGSIRAAGFNPDGHPASRPQRLRSHPPSQGRPGTEKNPDHRDHLLRPERR
jgi:hypothetical protein